MKTLAQLIANKNLHTRIISSFVLAPVALAALWWGGPVAIVATALISAMVYYEWARLTGSSCRSFLFFMSQAIIAITAVLLVLQANEFAATFWIILVVLIGFIHFLFKNADSWKALGLLYALTLLVTLLLLRQSPTIGFEAALFVVLVVWVTDSSAYFAGSLIGGKKLLPKISPQKTFAGFYGGLAAAVIVGIVLAFVFKLPSIVMPVLMALVLSLASQIGDLFESWVKRKFHVKDSGGLIPGHGGALDRLDSLVAASLVAYLIGAARAGLASPAQGLLIW
ncbi:MAG: CDP-archaeol synthase [Pseudomonadota bacterium]